MSPPRWSVDATDVDDGDLTALLDGDRALSTLVADATDALDEEVELVVARAREVPRRRFAPALVGVGVGAVALALVVALVALLGRPGVVPAVALVGTRIEAAPAVAVAAVRFDATGEGAWRVAQDDAAGVVVIQEAGVVTYDVEPLPHGRTFRVRAAGVEVVVVGTSFVVGLDGPEPWVAVRHGRVLVRDAGREQVLDPGDRWTRIVEPPATPEPPAPRPRVARAEPARPEAPTAASPEESPGRRLAALLDRVDEGERTEALAAELEAWAAAHPDSPLAAEATASALEVGAPIRDPRSTHAALEAWLATHPDSPRREGLLELQGQVARDGLGDCALAARSWEPLARGAKGERRARATARLGLCAARDGRLDEARTLLREALSLGLTGPLAEEARTGLEELDPD